MNHDPTDLRGQEREAIERRKLDKHAAQEEREDVKWLMKSRQGRRIAWRLLELTGVFRSSFTGNNETFFREGMRNVGLYLVGQINAACPEQYHTMVKEHQNAGSHSSD